MQFIKQLTLALGARIMSIFELKYLFFLLIDKNSHLQFDRQKQQFTEINHSNSQWINQNARNCNQTNKFEGFHKTLKAESIETDKVKEKINNIVGWHMTYLKYLPGIRCLVWFDTFVKVVWVLVRNCANLSLSCFSCEHFWSWLITALLHVRLVAAKLYIAKTLLS